MWIYGDTGVHSRVLSLLWFCTNFAEGSVAFLELLYAFSLLEFLKKWDLPLPIYPLQNSAGYPGEQVLWHSWWPHSLCDPRGLTCYLHCSHCWGLWWALQSLRPCCLVCFFFFSFKTWVSDFCFMLRIIVAFGREYFKLGEKAKTKKKSRIEKWKHNCLQFSKQLWLRNVSVHHCQIT